MAAPRPEADPDTAAMPAALATGLRAYPGAGGRRNGGGGALALRSTVLRWRRDWQGVIEWYASSAALLFRCHVAKGEELAVFRLLTSVFTHFPLAQVQVRVCVCVCGLPEPCSIIHMHYPLPFPCIGSSLSSTRPPSETPCGTAGRSLAPRLRLLCAFPSLLRLRLLLAWTPPSYRQGWVWPWAWRQRPLLNCAIRLVLLLPVLHRPSPLLPLPTCPSPPPCRRRRFCRRRGRGRWR